MLAAMDRAAAEIRIAARRHRERSLAAWRIDAPIVEIDRMLDELETMNLSGRRRVPLGWEPRLQRFLASIPAGCRQELRGNISPNRLMDSLYEIQDRLLDLKIGPLRHALLSTDRDQEFAVA